MMAEATLSLREKHTLEHLRRAEELGTTLSYYATTYELDVSIPANPFFRL